jgi:three-Cys-motif partner protein
MGRVSGSGASRRQPVIDDKTLALFDELPPADSEGEVLEAKLIRSGDAPIWTENKAQVIRRYLNYFVYVTKHGTYLDAFAGPQTGQPNDQAWAAKLVLENQPNWMNRFVLCDESPTQVAHLQALVDSRRSLGDKRKVKVLLGNSNQTLPAELVAAPIKQRQAAFCLLDQRTFECDWATVDAVARHKADGNKVELFYFLPVGWLFRCLPSVDEGKLARWWGSDTSELRRPKTQGDMSKVLMSRLRRAYGYRHVYAWPIHERSEGGKIMFFMVHASDHDDAPRLMTRAYRKATLTMEPMEHLQRAFDGEGFSFRTRAVQPR